MFRKATQWAFARPRLATMTVLFLALILVGADPAAAGDIDLSGGSLVDDGP